MVKESKISNILLVRRNIIEYLREIRYSKDLNLQVLEKLGEYFLQHDTLIIPLLIEEIQKEDNSEVLYKFEYLLKYLDNPKIVKSLINILNRNKDKIKLKSMILRVLKYYNVDFSTPALQSFHRELVLESENIANNLLKYYDTDWLEFAKVFKDFTFIDNTQLDVLRLIEKNNDKKKYGIFLTMLLTNNNNLISTVISTLGKSFDIEAADVLKKALLFLPTKYHNLIEQNLRKLRFKGIRDNNELIEENNILSCYLSYPYYEGKVTILYRLKKDNKNILMIIRIDPVHCVDDKCVLYTPNSDIEAEEILKMNIKYLNLKKVENGYEIRLLNNAIFFNYVNDYKFPPLFSVFINFLPSYYFKPLYYNPEKIREKFTIISDRELLIKNSDKIWDIIEGLKWLNIDYDFISIISRWYVNSKKNEHLWMDELFIRKVLREIIIPDLTDWKNKLLFLADFLDNINEHKEYIELILAVYDEIEKDIEKLEKIPFIRKLILGSKEQITNFL